MQEFHETPEDRIEAAHEDGQAARYGGRRENPNTPETPEAMAWDRGFRGLPLVPSDDEILDEKPREKGVPSPTPYQRKTSDLRQFLATNRATVVERLELSDGTAIETWKIQGFDFLFRIDKAGNWRAFTMASQSPEPARDLEGIELFLSGHRRTDLDLLADSANLARTFLSRLDTFPVCTDLDCIDPSCKETKTLKAAIQGFLDRLYPQPSERKE